METRCQHCGDTSTSIQTIDVPENVFLCERCCLSVTWRCDSCGRRIALPDIEGGELSGYTPFEFEQWCNQCCEQKLGTCDYCISTELLTDMQSTEDLLLCANCAKGQDFDFQDCSPLLTADNWKDAVDKAIDDLPDDIKQSVGYCENSTVSMTLTVAGEPFPDDKGESSISKVDVVYRESIPDEYLQSGVGEFFELKEVNSEEGCGHMVVVEGDSEFASTGLYVGRATVNFLISHIQLSLLEEMWSGGSTSIVFKDERGRFVREDGTRILSGQ